LHCIDADSSFISPHRALRGHAFHEVFSGGQSPWYWGGYMGGEWLMGLYPDGLVFPNWLTEFKVKQSIAEIVFCDHNDYGDIDDLVTEVQRIQKKVDQVSDSKSLQFIWMFEIGVLHHAQDIELAAIEGANPYPFMMDIDFIQKLFLRCFDEGITNPVVRPNTTDWINKLTAKPNIIFFKSDKETIISGIEINLSWEVEGAEKIEINQEIGIVQEKSEIVVKPNENPIFKITATNVFGIVESEIKLNIFPTPIIKTLQIPTPIFNHQTSISNFKIESPKIEIGVDLNPNLFVQPTMNFEKLNSESRNFFHSNKLKINPISEVFEFIQNQISIKLKNRFS
jgi:hypothetical protein